MFRLLATIFCFSSMLLTAQESNLGNWYFLVGNKKLNEKINWHHEVQHRNYNLAGDLEQFLFRTGFGMKIADKTNFLIGYGFFHNQVYTTGASADKAIVNEHRIFQQLITKQTFSKLSLRHRYRFEQRFFEVDFRLRFRYSLAVTIPIWKQKEGKRQLYLSVSDEIFINAVPEVFDRNRLYGGLSYRFNDNLRISLGYMNQFLNRRNRDQLTVGCNIGW